jgi:hypothetical protein
MKNHKVLMYVLVFVFVLLNAQFGYANNNTENRDRNIPTTVEQDDVSIFDASETSSKPERLLLARRGCCSWHGGVCGCDSNSNRIVCCDGTVSPSCTCSGY